MSAQPGVTLHPVFEIFSLAYINDVTITVDHAIDPRCCRQGFQITTNGFRAFSFMVGSR